MRVTGQQSFIRSIRVRYLSGLFILAVACGAIIFAMNSANSFRHEVDDTAADFATLVRDLRKAEAFAGQAIVNWRADTRDERISMTWRWTSRRGRPDTNPGYFEGRQYSDAPRRPGSRTRRV